MALLARRRAPGIVTGLRRRVEMAEVLLFHHAQGLTPGVVSFADTLRRAGHSVHTPDLFDGRSFDTLEQGIEQSHIRQIERIVNTQRTERRGIPEGGKSTWRRIYANGTFPSHRAQS
jgi:hypothetical protein